MAYARFIDSSIYMYGTTEKDARTSYILCVMCRIADHSGVRLSTYTGAIQHVKDHIEQRDHVPDDCLPRLEEEKRKYGNNISRAYLKMAAEIRGELRGKARGK